MPLRWTQGEGLLQGPSVELSKGDHGPANVADTWIVEPAAALLLPPPLPPPPSVGARFSFFYMFCFSHHQHTIRHHEPNTLHDQRWYITQLSCFGLGQFS